VVFADVYVSMNSSDFVDYVTLLIQVVTLATTVIGLIFVVKALHTSQEQQRMEAGPYIRIDLGSVTEDMPGFTKPDTYYRRLLPDTNDSTIRDESTIEMSAWFRNYQTHSLGLAFTVEAQFLVEVEGADPFVSDVHIPYLENGKAVAVDLIAFDRGVRIAVSLLNLSYLDFYDRRYEHVFGTEGTNALHGRLICTFEDGRFRNRAEGRSMEEGADFQSESWSSPT